MDDGTKTDGQAIADEGNNGAAQPGGASEGEGGASTTDAPASEPSPQTGPLDNGGEAPASDGNAGGAGGD